MKNLVQHLMQVNREQILSRSLLHCHAKNVHSIMLLECPGKTIRLFVAEPNHELWKNNRVNIFYEQTVSFHAHHCELTLLPVTDCVGNWEMRKVYSVPGSGIAPPSSDELDEYQYQSKITHGKIGFKKLGSQYLSTTAYDFLTPGVSHYMPAETIHTIFLPRGVAAAWFALEGRENPEHDNKCWSFTDQSKIDFSEFYKPMSEVKLVQLLKLAGLYLNSL